MPHPCLSAARRAGLLAAMLVLGAAGAWPAARAATADRAARAHPARSARRLPEGFIGVNLGSPVFPDAATGPALGHQLDEMVASGVETVRVEFDWEAAQPYMSWSEVTPAERPFYSSDGVDRVPTNFTAMDALVAAAATRGLSLVPVIVEAPGWDGVYFAGSFLSIPDRNAPYAAFCRALVLRYGPRGTFWRTHRPALPIRRWQIWNEPNLSVFWPMQPFAPKYVSLLAAAHAAITRADPHATVILAGLTNFSWVALRQIYAIRGARGAFDAVALHPYTRSPSGIVTILVRGRRVMDAFGDHDKPILADEISWPSATGQTAAAAHYDFATTEAAQAREVGAALPLLAAQRTRLGLGGVDYYTWATTEKRGGPLFDFAGLLKQVDGTLAAKPVLAVFRRVVLALEGCRAKGASAGVCRVPAGR